MTSLYTIQVRERGREVIPAEIWRRLSSDPVFWSLVESGILGVAQVNRGSFELKGGMYVGRVTCSHVNIEVIEKVPGVLNALIKFATFGSFRVESLTAQDSDLGELTRLLAHQFLLAIKDYVTFGRDFAYKKRPAVSPFVRGRLDVVRTTRLRARGMGHLVAFDRAVIDHATDKNQVLLRALRELERLARIIPISEHDLSASRTIAIFFSDCRNNDVLFGSRRSWALLAEQLAEQQDRAEHRDMLALAGVLLSHRGFEAAKVDDGLVPRSWFLNLEELFESAVRRTFAELLDHTWTVANGKRLRVPIFGGSRQTYRADPDIVLKHKDLVFVGDVKHKEWYGGVVQADIYQVLVHAKTYGAFDAFLVFPGEEYLEQDLGMSSLGVRTRLYSVDPRQLDSHLTCVLASIGVTQGVNSPGSTASAG